MAVDPQLISSYANCPKSVFASPIADRPPLHDGVELIAKAARRRCVLRRYTHAVDPPSTPDRMDAGISAARMAANAAIACMTENDKRTQLSYGSSCGRGFWQHLQKKRHDVLTSAIVESSRCSEPSVARG